MKIANKVTDVTFFISSPSRMTRVISRPLQLSHFIDIVKILTANNLVFRSCEMSIRINNDG
jgi:hypothetical protein